MKKRETIMIAIIMSVLLICGCEEIMKHESGYNSVNVSLYDFDNKGETDELRGYEHCNIVHGSACVSYY